MSFNPLVFDESPEDLKHENLFSNILRDMYAREKHDTEISSKKALTESKQLENALVKEFGRKESQADLELKKQQAYHHQQSGKYAGQTNIERDLKSAGFEPGTKEFQEAMQRQYGVGASPKPGVPGSLLNAPAVQQNQTISRMTEELSKAKDGEAVLYNLKKFRQLNDKYPNMWKDFNQLFTLDDPDQLPKLTNILLNKYIGNEEKIEAITLASKYANQIALRTGAEFGKNFTDAKFKAVQKTKMNPKYPWKVNDEIMKDVEHEFSYIPKYKEDLDNGLREYYPVYPNYDDYRTVEIRNKKTGETKTVTKREARELKARGLK